MAHRSPSGRSVCPRPLNPGASSHRRAGTNNRTGRGVSGHWAESLIVKRNSEHFNFPKPSDWGMIPPRPPVALSTWWMGVGVGMGACGTEFIPSEVEGRKGSGGHSDTGLGGVSCALMPMTTSTGSLPGSSLPRRLSGRVFPRFWCGPKSGQRMGVERRVGGGTP